MRLPTNRNTEVEDLREEVSRLQAELVRIKASHVTRDEEIQRRHDACAPLANEIQRLRAALTEIQHWDCLNPPDATLCADHPWLKRLVDSALRSGGGSA